MKRDRTTDIILKLSQGIREGIESRRLFALILESIMDLTRADSCAIVTFESSGKIECKATQNISNIECNNRKTVAGAIIREVARTGYPLACADISKEDVYQGCNDGKVEKSILCVPYACRGSKMLGVFYLEKKGSCCFDATIKHQLSGLAELIALTISQARSDREEIQVIYDNVHTGLMVIDVNCIVCSVNKFASNILACNIEACIGENCFDLFGGTVSELVAAIQVTLRNNKRATCVFSIDRPDGQRVVIDVAVSPLPTHEREVKLLLSFEDNSERQKLFADAAQREKMASIGTLAAGVAHEFNNIWAAVHGYAELAKANPKFLPELADVALEQADRASQIISSLLSFSDKRPELRHGVRLGRILRGVSQLVEMELRANSVELDVDIKKNPDIVGSEGQLQQIFLNLVINAFHAINSHGKIKVVLDKVGSSAVVTVSDNGCGMNPQQLKHIFDPFFTTKGALGGSEKHKGHGLGLTLTYNLIKAHNGRIEVKSKLNEGTVFRVILPLDSLVNDAESGVMTVTKPLDTIAGKQFLLVEDEVILHGLMRSILRGQKMDVVVSGEEAIELLKEKSYDAIFLDIVLKGDLSGFDVFDYLQEKHSKIPVIIITGRTEEKRLAEYLPLASTYIKKPFTVAMINDAITLALSGLE